MKKRRRPRPPSALGSAAAKDLQADLAGADALFNAQKYDEAIAAYRQIMAKAPALSVINLQIAAAYRNKKEYDNAIAAYNDLLKADPDQRQGHRRHRHDQPREGRSRRPPRIR